MKHHRLLLTEKEFDDLNRRFPASEGSGLIGRRAAAIVELHFKRQDPRCTFVSCPPGVDLHVQMPDAEALPIEIKGTAATLVAWPQLKVSSTNSHRLIVDGMPVYRVCNVFGREIDIYILRHGVDFILEPEPRWAFRPVRSLASADRSSPAAASSNSPQRRRGSKYDALREYLRSQDSDEVTLSLCEAESLLGFSLPASAYEHQAYWANQTDTGNRPWARAWSEAGFIVDGYHLATDGWVRFKRRSG